MSLDFQVFVSERLGVEFIRDFTSQNDGVQLEPSSHEKSHWLLMASKGQFVSAVSIDGPFSVDPDYLPNCVAESTLQPKWTYRMTTPASAPAKAVQCAKALCTFLADKGKGVAYDMQEDRVFFPKSHQRYKANSVGEERIDVINLQFMLPLSIPKRESAATLLAIFRKYCPECIPTRFGRSEPFSEKMEPGNDDPFLEMWSQALSADFASLMFWKGKAPSFGGSFAASDRRTELKRMPERFARRHDLKLSFDGRALTQDTRWCEQVVELFRTIAVRLNAFYAGAYLDRNVILRRNTLWYGRGSQSYFVCAGQWWLGLPFNPTWLAWYGPTYSKVLAPYLSKSDYAQWDENCIFLRMGPQPTYVDELRARFPSLPESYLMREFDVPISVPPFVSPRREAAMIIPDVDQ
jgi:hypothetical protein